MFRGSNEPLTSKNIYTLNFDLFSLFNLVIISSYLNDTCQLSLVMTDILLRNLSVKGQLYPLFRGSNESLTSKNIYTLKFDLFNLFNPVIISSYINDTCQLSIVMKDFLLRNLFVKEATLPFVQGFKRTPDFQIYIYIYIYIYL